MANIETDQGPTTPPLAEVRRSRWISVAWLIPLVAALLGAALAYRMLTQKGPLIEIAFPTAAGLEAGKTPIKVKAVEVGIVTTIELADDLESVLATAMLRPGAERYLTSGTVFWLVRPRLELSGVSGLETVLSGQYIELIPGPGNATRRFVAQPNPPVQTRYPEAKVVVLETGRVGANQPGSPVYYRNVQVGEVVSVEANGPDRMVEIVAVVEKQYARHVRKTTQFWNASGVQVSLGLDGLAVQAEGIKAVLGGGIAFDTPDEEQGEEAPSVARFTLFSGRDDARRHYRRTQSLAIELESDSAEGLNPGAAVLFRNVPIGELGARRLSEDAQRVVQEAYIDPPYRRLIRKNSRFWKVRGVDIDVGITGVRARLGALKELVAGGVAVNMPNAQADPVEPGARFYLHEEPRAEWLTWSAAFPPAAPGGKAPPRELLGAPGDAGLEVVLVADDAASLRAGTPVIYRGVPIGEITRAALADTANGAVVEAQARITPAHRNLVTERARFWLAGGLSADLSMDGLRIEAPTGLALLTGEVRMEVERQGTPVRPGARFVLHPSRDAAQSEIPRPKPFVIYVEAAEATVSAGAEVYHRGHRIGRVTGSSLTRDAYAVRLGLEIEPAYVPLIRSDTRFWPADPLRVKVDLAGVRIDTAPLKAIVGGGLHLATPTGSAAAAVSGSVFLLGEEPKGWRSWRPAATLKVAEAGKALDRDAAPGLELLLKTAQTGSVGTGQHVLYRGVIVGTVGEPKLVGAEGEVQIPVTIERRYATLVRRNSHFWNISGVRFHLGLGGLTIGAGSLDSLLRGGVAFSTPSPPGEPAGPASVFTLHEEQAKGKSAPSQSPGPDSGSGSGSGAGSGSGSGSGPDPFPPNANTEF